MILTGLKYNENKKIYFKNNSYQFIILFFLKFWNILN